MVCFQTFQLTFPLAEEADYKLYVAYAIYGLTPEMYESSRVEKGSNVILNFRICAHRSLYRILPPVLVPEMEVSSIPTNLLSEAREMMKSLNNRDKHGYEIKIVFDNPPDCEPKQLPSLIRYLTPNYIEKILKVDDQTYYVGSPELESVYVIGVKNNKLRIKSIDSYASFDIDDGFISCGHAGLNEIVKAWRHAGDIRQPIFPPTII